MKRKVHKELSDKENGNAFWKQKCSAFSVEV